MIKEVKGNLFESGIQAICHGCNTVGAMGAGIALQFAKRYPKMVVEYQRLCRMGHFTTGSCYVYQSPSDDRIIGNLGSQKMPGADATVENIELSLEEFILSLKEMGMKELGMPKIGCGIGGLDWETEVKPVVEQLADKHDFNISVYYF